MSISQPLTSCFYGLERRVFILEYRETHSPCLFCEKYEDEKKLPFFLIKTLD